MELILSHHLSLTFCWTFPLPQHVEIGIDRHLCIRILTCNSDTREDVKIYVTFFYNFFGTESDFFCQSFHLSCLPDGQSFPSNLVREKTIVLSVSDLCHCCQRQFCHDRNCMTLLWNIVHVHSTENTLPLSSQRWVSFLVDSWWLILFPQLLSELWSFEFSSSDQYEVLQTSSIVNNLSAHCFEQFLGRTKPRQSDAEQSPVILTCTTSKSWTSSFCNLFCEQVWESLSFFIGSGCTEMLIDHVSNLSPTWESVVFLSTLLFDTYSFAQVNVACREVFLNADAIIASISSPYNWSRCHKFVNWLCHLNFFDPVHCEMRICCFRTNISLEVDFPALKFHRVRKFSQMQFRNRKSRLIIHTTVRISSTSMIQHSTSILEVW